MKLGYLGPQGTYSERAAYAYAAGECELIPYLSIARVLEAVLRGEVDKGVVPVENSLEGAVNTTLDMLAAEELYTTAEMKLAITHSLYSVAETLTKVKRVYSHPQALGQCRSFLARELPDAEWVSTESTAAGLAAALVDREAAAIAPAGSEAGRDAHLIIDGISDHKQNTTRFWVVAGKPEHTPGAKKSSLALALPQNKPGGLYKVLGIFVRAKIDLSRIESRPAKKELGEYLFFIDCYADLAFERAEVAAEIKEKCVFFKILGTYSEA